MAIEIVPRVCSTLTLDRPCKFRNMLELEVPVFRSSTQGLNMRHRIELRIGRMWLSSSQKAVLAI